VLAQAAEGVWCVVLLTWRDGHQSPPSQLTMSCGSASADTISQLRMPRLAALSWESNEDASYRPACERIINCVQLPPWSSPCGHAIHLRSGRAGDLAARMYARKGPASALPTLLAEHPSSRATSSASPSVSASQRYPLLFGALQRADSSAATRVDYAGHFAHAALQPVKAYVPRSSLHAQIYAQLSRDAADSGTRKLVVWGLGGAGKTQLVLDYVQQHRTEYKATFWIEAGRKESLERDFVRLYQTLFGLHTSAGTEAVSVEDAVTGVKSWFAGQQGRWLMVFDGADTIEDGDAREYINIVHFVPDAAALDVIITSRSSTARDMTRLEGVQVGEMEAAQAAELFQKYARISRDDATVPDEVLAIVKELGCLALAVTLAATYVGSTPRLQSNIKAYLPEYRQRRRELLRRKPESLVHQYSESVLTTCETSYAAAAGQCVEATVLMTVLCFLSFDDIYLELFCAHTMADGPEQTEGERDASWRSLVSPQQALDVYKIEECFAALQKYSLVQWKADQKSYAIHKLVHAWGCDRLTAEEQSKYSQAAFELVIEAVEAVEGYSRGPEDKLRLVPHVMGSFQALTDVGNRSNQVTEALVNELESVGEFVTHLGRWPEAHAVKEYVLQARRRLLGEDHPDTIWAMSNLAITLREQGQLEEAAIIQKEVLEKRTQILSKEHPDTISAMSNLAITLGEQGHLERTAEIEREVLEKRRRILGEEHPRTISAMNNLANTLREQGQLEEAAVMQKEVLEKQTQILGEEHPDTILVMSNLAITLREQGQLEEAAIMQKEVLEKRTQILGKEHPGTISAMSNLAITLGEQGQLEEAAVIQKEVLEKRTQILGEEHPDTILVMSNLAITLGEQGQLEEAAKIEREVLEKRRRILGEEHPDTISAMNNLNITLRQQAQLHQEHSNTRRPVRSPVRPIESSSVIHATLQSPRRERIRVFAYIRSKLQK
jgi:tetratricopeptide (TPR) repeat protein